MDWWSRNKPKLQVLVIGLLALVLYGFLVRPQEILRAVLAVNDPNGRVLVFLAAERGGIFIFEADAAGTLTQLSEFAIDGPARGLTHRSYTGGRQILFVAAGENGLRILDVSVPTRPDEIGFLTAPGVAQAGAVVSQDERLYYLSAAGRAGLQVVDVTDPELPVLISTFDSRGFVADVVVSADEKTAYLADQRAGLVAVDIQKLANLSTTKTPEEIGTLRIPGQGREMLLNGEQLFIASGPGGLVIVDVADPSAPQLSTRYDSLPDANSLDIWRGYVYVADTQKGVRALNIFDRAQIFDVSKERYGDSPQALDILDGRIFVGDGILGLRVYDADVTLETARVARSATALQAHGVTQAGGGLLYVASPDRGLVLVDVSNPASPEIQEVYDEYKPLAAVTVGVDHAFLARGPAGVALVSITDPAEPLEVAQFDTNGLALGTLSIGDYLYVADGPGGFLVYEISNPSAPRPLGQLPSLSEVQDLARAGEKFVLAAGGPAGLFVLDVGTPATPMIVNRVDVRGSARAVFVDPDAQRAYLSDWTHGVIAIDIKDLPRVKVLGRYDSPGYVYDVWAAGATTYLADGYRGLGVVDFANPNAPQPAGEGVYETPGDARGLSLAGSTLYLADGARGLRIFDVSQPAAPVVVGVLDAPHTVQDLQLANEHVYAVDSFQPDAATGLWVFADRQAGRLVEQLPPLGFLEIPPYNAEPRGLFVSGKRGYLAAGQSGLRIIDLNNPANPALIPPRQPLPNLGLTRRVAVLDDIAYITAELQGLWLVDVSQPLTPTVVGHYTTPQQAGEVVVRSLGAQRYAYVADGDVGVRILNVTQPENVTPVSILTGVGSVRRLRFAGDLAYLVSAELGLTIADMRDPAQPQILSQTPAAGAAGVAVQRDSVYVAAGGEGLAVYNAAEPASPYLVEQVQKDLTLPVTVVEARPAAENPAMDIVFLAGSPAGVQALEIEKIFKPKQLAFFETPGTADLKPTFKAFLGLLIGKEDWVTPKAVATLGAVFLDGLIWLGVFLMGTLLLSQFVLPLRGFDDGRAAWMERGAAFLRVITQLFDPGPALLVHEGVIVAREGERKRRGPGVIFLDSASAAVLRSRKQVTRTVGPGLVFTAAGEHIVGTVPLMTRSTVMGPPDPQEAFAPQGREETDADFRARQERRRQTQVQLCDGNEVVATIRVSYRVDCEPGAGGSRYGYSADVVRRCIMGGGFHLNNGAPGEATLPNWQGLPGALAADVWREYARKFTLEEFFTYQPSSLEVEATGYETIQRLLRERLTQATYAELSPTGAPTAAQVNSREFQMLQERGIRVLGVNVLRVQFEPQVEQQIINQWEASWRARASQEADLVESQHSRAFHDGRALGVRDFALLVSEALLQMPNAAQRPVQRRLAQITERILRLMQEDAALQRRLRIEMHLVQEVVDWLRRP